MQVSRLAIGVCLWLLALQIPLRAQFQTPHVINTEEDVVAKLGTTTFTNHGLQGVGRISGSAMDAFGETFGSVSGLQITDWRGNARDGYSGMFQILPDRGYNNANGFLSDYAARIQQVNFTFKPSTNADGLIRTLQPFTGIKFRYADATTGNTASVTTGLDPGAGQATLFGKAVPYVVSDSAKKLALDAESLALKPDGSGYIGDEYGANVYYFNPAKEIVGVITPPEAFLPHNRDGGLNFSSQSVPADGRRNNQGFEGVALSPDGATLFAILQGATVQDGKGVSRLLVYRVEKEPTPDAPVAEYVLELPTYTANGQGGAPDAIAGVNEITAIDDHRLLVLARDSSGQGSVLPNPSMYKCVLLVDTRIDEPSNIAGTLRDAAGGKVTSSPGVLDPSLKPLRWVEAVNILNSAQLAKFEIDLDPGGAARVTKRTISEKWEGMSLVPANDPAAPNDYFLVVANDNDFLTSKGTMATQGGTPRTYDAFAAFPPARIPAVPDGSPTIENDTMFLAYRVTITP